MHACLSALEMAPLLLVSTTKCVCTTGALAVPLQSSPLLTKGQTRNEAPAASLMHPFITNAAGAAKPGAGGKAGMNTLSRTWA
jgi:hypothetical protein